MFQARLEPIHLQRQLERAMDAERRLGSRRTYVPSNYRVLLSPSDLQAFESIRDSLTADLADALHGHARSRGYTLTARPMVELTSSDDVGAGDVVVRAQPVTPPPRRQATNEPTDAKAGDSAPPALPATDEPGDKGGGAERMVAESAAAEASADEAPAVAIEGAGTSVYASPQARLPDAVLALRVPGHETSRIRVSSGTLRVGRALDNDIVISDDRVSRHHGQFSVRFGTLVYTDQGSTNGSYLNGSRVTEIALGPGDILQLGSSTVAVEQSD